MPNDIRQAAADQLAQLHSGEATEEDWDWEPDVEPAPPTPRSATATRRGR